MSKYDKPKNQEPKNPLEVDLGFFGKINNKRVSADKFFLRAENNQDAESVEALRQCYNDILVEHNIPRIEQLVTRFLKKIQGAESAGHLKQLMRNVTAEGLLEAQTGRDGRPYHYKPHPQIQRTSDLARAWQERKRKLHDRYGDIVKQPGSIRVTDQITLPRAHRPTSFSAVLNLTFGKSKNGQETVTIADCLPVHGPVVAIKGSTYISGYSAPQWLENATRQVKANLRKQEEEKAKKEAEKAKVITPADTATPSGDAVETQDLASQAPPTKLPVKPKAKAKKEKKAA
ncbi:hypothetical protein JW752_04315 [Candidatus Peregrinibacteria bacterium]|nr:hypothetical protein [Candidatus Peregrinibacteria bacterium]